MSLSAVKEFDFKLATAKDLPPSWYELVLRPNVFKTHLNSLYTSKNVEPSASLLVATFLEKASCIPGQPESKHPIRNRSTLVDCALFMAAYLQWDMLHLEEKLPPAVLHALFISLAGKFPLNSSPPKDVSMDTLCAHTLYCLWVVHCLSLKDTPPSFRGYQWEGLCSNLDIIKDAIRQELEYALKFLNDVLLIKQDFCIPCDVLKLPTKFDSKNDPSCEDDATCLVDLPFVLQSIPYKDIHAQIRYNLGKIYFENDQYALSLDHFHECRALLDTIRTRPLSIDTGKLTGYMTACKLVTKTQSQSPTNPLTTFESCRHGDVKEAVQNLPSPSSLLPASYRAGIEKELFDWSEMVAIENLKSKRRKLSDGSIGRGLTLAMQLSIWDIIQGVLEGRGINSTTLQTLNQNKSNEEYIDILLTSIGNVLCRPKMMGGVSDQLVLFLRTLSCNEVVLRCAKDNPLISNAMGIAKVHSLLNEPCPISQLVQAPGSVNQYNRIIPILVSSTPSSLMSVVSDLFQRTQESDHVPIANTLQGDYREFANVGQMNSPLQCAQYNGLIRKGMILAERKEYKSAVDFFLLALKILNLSSSPNRLRLVPILNERILKTKISHSCSMSSSNAKECYPTLLDDTKSHFTNGKNSSMELTLSGVFLLNMQDYSTLARMDHVSLHERVCPKLAIAAQCVREGQDLRRCTRELFDIVSSVFISGRGVSDTTNMLQRKSLEIVAMDLKDQLCLSYLMSALVKLWNLVKKPENELSCEYSTNWPTTVGSISSIKARQVMRYLEMTLSNGIRAHPSHHYWLVMKANILFATGKFNNALSLYLEAGMKDSDYFEKPVSSSIWNQQVLHRIIKSCCSIEKFSEAIVLCQWLEPMDYSLTFSLLKEHSSRVLEFMFNYLWNMTIIEYLIYMLSKPGDSAKQSTAIQTAGRSELNTNNSKEVLDQVMEFRKRTFLKTFYKTILVNV